MISGVVLAAGLSTRMGGTPKALLPVGESDVFVTRVVRTLFAGGLPDVVVVVGYQADLVERAIRTSGLPARLVLNAAFEEGQLASLRAGLDAVDRSGTEALMLSLVDTPFFSAQTVDALVRRFHETQAPVVRPVREGEHGHPVLIGRQLFDAIRHADTAAGAKPIVRQHVSLAGDVVVQDAGAFVDVDTPDDYARVSRLWAGERGLPSG